MMNVKQRVRWVMGVCWVLSSAAGCAPPEVGAPAGGASAAVSIADVVGEGVLENALHVDMPSVPERGVLRLSRGEVPFELENRTESEVTVRVAGRVLAEGGGHGIDLGEVTVGAGRRVSLRVPTDRARIDYRALRSPARVAIVAEVLSSSGLRTISDEVFVHEERDSTGRWTRVAYRAAERQRVYAGGDLAAPRGSIPPPGRLDWAYQGPGVGGGDGGAGEGNFEFCLKYKVDVVDYGVGEDHHAHGDNWVFYPSYLMATGLWTAHGARFRLYDPATATWSEDAFADPETGCFSFTSRATTGFIVRVYAESQLAGNNRIRGYESDDALYDNSSAPYWDIAADPGASSGSFIYFTPPSGLSSLMGVSTWTVHHLDELSDHPFANRELRVVADICQGDNVAYGSCYGGNTLWVQPSNDDRKFLVSHEVGHFIEAQWGGFSPNGGSYAYDDANPACAFDGVGLHAMRSREQATLSFREAMAHFISLLAYNDPDGGSAFFEYYKHHQPPAPLESYAYDLIDVAADVPAPAGGDVGWNDAACEAYLTPAAGYSVEQDWLRFFWDYVTDPGGPALADFVGEVGTFYGAGGLNSTNAYTRFAASLEGTPSHARWTSLAETHAVDYPQ